jgi:hypothetical protein
MSITTNPIQAVPPYPEQGAFTAQYKRYGWEASVHFVLDKSNNYRAYVSDYTVSGTPTLQDISRISTKVHADFNKWVSQTRLINWATRNGMHFTRWQQQADNTLEVIA